MKTSARVLLSALALVLPASTASAQVVLTEIQPNPTGSDFAEWVEIQNIGPTMVDIGDWTLSELLAGNESTQWAFPTGTLLAPDQVIVVARQSFSFKSRSAVEWGGMPPDFELAFNADDPMVPNLTGGPNFNLDDNMDAVILRDGLGAYMDGVEYGADSTQVAGAPVLFWPTMSIQNEGAAIRRVDTAAGTSEDDWAVVATGDPTMGYQVGVGTPPMIISHGHEPLAFVFGQDSTLTATVVDSDGVADVTFHVAIASSVDGPADTPYVEVQGTVSDLFWFARARTENFDASLSFTDPTTFTERYIRWYVEATDGRGAVALLPEDATPDANNTSFFWENVLPSAGVATIAEARQQDGQRMLMYEGHTVRVEGVATTNDTAFSQVEFNAFLSDPANLDAVLVQDNILNAVRVDMGDVIRVTGKIGQFNGQRFVGEDTGMGQARFRGFELVIDKLGTDTPPEQTVTIATLMANGEAYEGQLVVIPNVDMAMGPNGEPIPTTFMSNMTAWISDGTRLEVRVASATGLEGTPVPTDTFSMRGIFTETFSGYRVQPRGAMDILPAMEDVDAGVVDSGVVDSGVVDPDRDAGMTTNPDRDAGTTDPVRDGGFAKGGDDEDNKGGCGCHIAEGRGSAALGVLAMLGLVVMRRRRR